MSKTKLNVWSILNRAFLAPFRLSTRSWINLSRPIGAILATSATAYVVSQNLPGGKLPDAIAIVSLIAFAWLLFTLVREYLRSTVGTVVPAGTWRTFFQFLVGSGMVLAVFAITSAIVFYAVMPLMLFFAFSVAGETPLLAFGSLVMYGVAMLVGAYPAARLIAALPALAVGKVGEAKNVWARTAKNGMRLLFVLVIPVALHVYVENTLLFNNPSPGNFVAAIMITSYILFVQIATMACIYSDIYGGKSPDQPGIESRSSPGWVAVAGMVVIAGVSTLLGSFGNLIDQTTESSSDQFASSPNSGPFSTSFQDTFLTGSKDSVTLTATSEWDVLDEDRFQLATGGSVRHAEMRIKDITRAVIRNTISRQEFDETRLVFDTPSDDVLRQTNQYSEELGVRVERIALQPPQSGT